MYSVPVYDRIYLVKPGTETDSTNPLYAIIPNPTVQEYTSIVLLRRQVVIATNDWSDDITIEQSCASEEA